MILVSTGTNGEPFDRLLQAVARLELDEELVVQHGPSRVRAAGATSLTAARFDEFSELVRRARVVVTHGGVGSVLVALTHGHRRPLVVPRLARHGEAIDDHQLDFARRLDAAGLVTLVTEPDRLGPLLTRTAAADDGIGSPRPLRPEDLSAELGAYLRQVVASGRRPRPRPVSPA